jgi:L-fucose mutarotase
MLKYKLLHPEILGALGAAGHGSKIMIADSNYPFSTRANPGAKRVYLNFAPGLISATDILKGLVEAIPVESADVMLTNEAIEPPIAGEFRAILGRKVPVHAHERFAYYDLCKDPDTALVIASGEQRIYANILLTIGVVHPPKG